MMRVFIRLTTFRILVRDFTEICGAKERIKTEREEDERPPRKAGATIWTLNHARFGKFRIANQ